MAKYYNKNSYNGKQRWWSLPFSRNAHKNLVDQGNEVIVSLPKGKNIPKLIELGCQIIETQ